MAEAQKRQGQAEGSGVAGLWAQRTPDTTRAGGGKQETKGVKLLETMERRSKNSRPDRDVEQQGEKASRQKRRKKKQKKQEKDGKQTKTGRVRKYSNKAKKNKKKTRAAGEWKREMEEAPAVPSVQEERSPGSKAMVQMTRSMMEGREKPACGSATQMQRLANGTAKVRKRMRGTRARAQKEAAGGRRRCSTRSCSCRAGTSRQRVHSHPWRNSHPL